MRDANEVVPERSNRREIFNKTFREHPPLPTGVTCPSYEALPGTKRCQHYLNGGACSLPTEFMCIEWLKVNGNSAQTITPAPPIPQARGLFQLQSPSVPPRTPPTAASPVRANPADQPISDPPVRTPAQPLAPDALAGFQALGVEVALDVGGTRVHLVPGYSSHDRLEISHEHAATLRLLLDAFPGARVVGFERVTSSNQEVCHE